MWQERELKYKQVKIHCCPAEPVALFIHTPDKELRCTFFANFGLALRWLAGQPVCYVRTHCYTRFCRISSIMIQSQLCCWRHVYVCASPYLYVPGFRVISNILCNSNTFDMRYREEDKLCPVWRCPHPHQLCNKTNNGGDKNVWPNKIII